MQTKITNRRHRNSQHHLRYLFPVKSLHFYLTHTCWNKTTLRLWSTSYVLKISVHSYLLTDMNDRFFFKNSCQTCCLKDLKPWRTLLVFQKHHWWESSCVRDKRTWVNALPASPLTPINPAELATQTRCPWFLSVMAGRNALYV